MKEKKMKKKIESWNQSAIKFFVRESAARTERFADCFLLTHFSVRNNPRYIEHIFPQNRAFL